MEFNQSMRAAAPAHSPSGAAASGSVGGGKASRSWKGNPMWLRVALIVLLFAATAVVVVMVVLVYLGGNNEQTFVNKSQEQAVFLTNGQVYFGHVKSVNKQYVDLEGIYYLNVNQQVQPNQSGSSANAASNQSVSLVKLGCELHGPTDQMLINRDQVTFWENLKSDGQVTTAITQWVKQNPTGQKCTTSNSTSNSSSTSNTTKP
ncbi:MAG TPA: hypothetical protein VLH84_05905 [Patescibacteria group bacterium]|nr:hypothetical protein [Patescibacteria group bacterium]